MDENRWLPIFIGHIFVLLWACLFHSNWGSRACVFIYRNRWARPNRYAVLIVLILIFSLCLHDSDYWLAIVCWQIVWHRRSSDGVCVCVRVYENAWTVRFGCVCVCVCAWTHVCVILSDLSSHVCAYVSVWLCLHSRSVNVWALLCNCICRNALFIFPNECGVLRQSRIYYALFSPLSIQLSICLSIHSPSKRMNNNHFSTPL